ncbi:MAG: hypothetical protein AB7O97_15800 [Planctomycetota bacterium]
MPLLATLTIACLGLSPQGGAAAQNPPLLTAQEQKSLQSKLAKLIEARTEYDSSSSSNPRLREKAQRGYEQAKDAFTEEWEARVAKKGDILGSPADLEAIFANVIAYERKSGVTMRKINEKDDIPEHCLYVPKGYKSDSPIRTVLLVPGKGDDGEWADGVKWYEEAWGKSNPADADTMFHVPHFSEGLDLDAMPDYSSLAGEATETQRIGELMRSFGETQRTYNVDRARLFLDAAKDGCGFALRVATHFPDRFAGLILRHPVDVPDLRLGSLGGVSVLLISSPATAAACEKLKERLDAVSPSICTILEGKGEYPFRDSAADIETWMDGVRRTVNHRKVVLEPNDDRFRKGFWVAIETMDSVHLSPEGMKPRVVAEADPDQNRIKIDTVGVEAIYLQLNDALVDLDKPFTILINGKAITEERRREFNRMLDFMLQRFDGEFLFPVQFKVQVPEPEARASEAGGGK